MSISSNYARLVAYGAVLILVMLLGGFWFVDTSRPMLGEDNHTTPVAAKQEKLADLRDIKNATLGVSRVVKQTSCHWHKQTDDQSV